MEIWVALVGSRFLSQAGLERPQGALVYFLVTWGLFRPAEKIQSANSLQIAQNPSSPTHELKHKIRSNHLHKQSSLGWCPGLCQSGAWKKRRKTWRFSLSQWKNQKFRNIFELQPKSWKKNPRNWFLWYNLIKGEEISKTGVIVPLGKIWMSVTSFVLKHHRDGGIQIKAWLKRESCLYTAYLCFVPPQHYYTTVFFSQMPVWTLMPDSQDAICASQFRVSWGYYLVYFKSPFSPFVHIYHSCCIIVHSSVSVILETVVSVAVRWWSAVTETKTHIRFSQSCNKLKK